MLQLSFYTADTKTLNMSYLKIFPRSIAVTMSGDGGYVGQLLYDYEQYGRMMYDDDSDVRLMCAWQPKPNWFICTTRQTHSLAGFSVFMHALNHYLFDVLQFDPVSQWSKISPTEYEYYFERVYFDLGTREFTAVKKLTVPDAAESSHNIFTEKRRG